MPSQRDTWRVWGVALLLPLASAVQADAVGDSPFLWRNAAPFTAFSGLPRARSAQLPAAGTVHADLIFELANHFAGSSAPGEAVTIDAETATLVARFETGLGDGWAASVELVGVRHSGGILDGLIDRWHGWFGFPDGGRDRAPRDRLYVSWRVDGEEVFLLEDAHTGVGDMRIGLARRLHGSAARDVTARLDLELPTGRPGRLTGSGGVDAAVTLALTERTAFSALGLTSHLGMGVVRPAGDDLIGARLRDWVGHGSWTLVWPLGDRLRLKGQLDAHTAVVRSNLREVGGWSIQGGLGIAWQATPGLALEVAIYEDLRPGSAPDVSFQFGFRGVY